MNIDGMAYLKIDGRMVAGQTTLSYDGEKVDIGLILKNEYIEFHPKKEIELVFKPKLYEEQTLVSFVPRDITVVSLISNVNDMTEAVIRYTK